MGNARESLGTRLVAAARDNPVLTLAVILAAGIGGWFAIMYFFPGQSRRVLKVIRSTRTAIVERDFDAALEHVSKRFYTDGVDRDDLNAALHGIPPEALPTRIVLRVVEQDVSGHEALVIVVVHSSNNIRRITSEWMIILEKAQGRWQILRCRPRLIGNREADGLDSLLKRGLRGGD